jgi:hypothetical protein
MLLALAKSTAAMTALARIRRRHLCNGHTNQMGFIGDEVLQLAERPIVPILSCIRFGGLALPCTGTDARQVFEGFLSQCSYEQVYISLQ